MEQGKILKLLDENGEEKEYEVAMSYLCNDNGKAYIFYTDNTFTPDGNMNLFASVYTGDDENGEPILEEITDENEWALLDKVMEEVNASTGGEQ